MENLQFDAKRDCRGLPRVGEGSASGQLEWGGGGQLVEWVGWSAGRQLRTEQEGVGSDQLAGTDLPPAEQPARTSSTVYPRCKTLATDLDRTQQQQLATSLREAPVKDNACSNGILPNSVSTPSPPQANGRFVAGIFRQKLANSLKQRF